MARIKDNNSDKHAEQRDRKLRKKKKALDNRKSIQLIAKLSSNAKDKRKT
jgi:hypothetical protein